MKHSARDRVRSKLWWGVGVRISLVVLVFVTFGIAACGSSGSAVIHGGIKVVYRATEADGSQVTSAELSQTISIINRRVNGLGVTEALVQKQASDQLSVSLPGVTDIQHAIAIIGKTAQLEFYEDYKWRVAGPANSITEAVKQARAQTKFVIPAADLKALAKGRQTKDWSLITAPLGKLGNNKSTVYFIYKHSPDMTGKAISDARQSFDNSEPDLSIDFTSQGGDQFAAVTRDLAFQGALLQQNLTFAIVLDDSIESDPYVDYKKNPNGISGGSAIISGSLTVGEAKDLALVLRSGALPVTLLPISQSILK